MPLSRLLRVPAVCALALLSGCSSITSTLGLDGGEGASTAPTSGVAVGDEPLAVKTGAAILSQGGSAADAATAMFFTLAATYPVAPGLGGGGICLVRDANGGAREFDFLPRAAAAGGAFAVPGAVRGFYDMQQAFGTLAWQRDVAPGEAYAATGFPISHILSLRLASAQNVIRLDASLSAEFLDESGQPKAEGAVVTNVPLSQTIDAVRQSGADGFYRGDIATALSAYARSQGGAISAADIASYRSQSGAGRLSAIGAGNTVILPGVGTGAGAFAGALLTNMTSQTGSPEAAAASAVRQTLQTFGVSSVPPDLGATGFAAVDSNGQAVGCAVTLNGPFGAGHTAGSTGVTLAAAPSAATGIAGAFLTPVLMTDAGGQVTLAGVGAGGPNGSAAILYAALKLARGQELGRSSDLRSTGLAPMVTVNVISCQSGACLALPDPGAHGLGEAAQSGDAASQ